MKKLISLALAVLLLLNLAACGDGPAPSSSGSSGDVSSSADPAQPDAFSPVTTDAEVRALYGDAVKDVWPANDHPDGCLGLDLAPKQGRIQPQQPTADTALTVDPVQAGAVLVRSQFHQEISLVRLDGGDKACVVPIESPNFRLRGDGGEGNRPGGHWRAKHL